MATPHEVLSRYADDSEVSIESCSEDKLTLKVKVDSQGGQVWRIKCWNFTHIDLAPSFILGNIEFGGQELLPTDYLATRNQGCEGDEDTYRVLKFTDDAENNHFVIMYGKEEIKTS